MLDTIVFIPRYLSVLTNLFNNFILSLIRERKSCEEFSSRNDCEMKKSSRFSHLCRFSSGMSLSSDEYVHLTSLLAKTLDIFLRAVTVLFPHLIICISYIYPSCSHYQWVTKKAVVPVV